MRVLQSDYGEVGIEATTRGVLIDYRLHVLTSIRLLSVQSSLKVTSIDFKFLDINIK